MFLILPRHLKKYISTLVFNLNFLNNCMYSVKLIKYITQFMTSTLNIL